MRQATLAAGLAHLVEVHGLTGEALQQLLQVLLVADVARAARVPEMHEAHRPRALQRGGQAQGVAGEEFGALALEGAQVARLEPPERGEHGGAPEQGDQGGDQVFATCAHGRFLAGCASLP